VTDVLSTTYEFGADSELDRLVPQKLALEPGISARKYFAPGIGFFLEVKPNTGDVVQLVDCNVDPRCCRRRDGACGEELPVAERVSTLTRDRRIA